MKVLAIGDIHGGIFAMKHWIDYAVRNDCPTLFQVGDWGLGFPNYKKFNHKVSSYAVENNIDIYFIRGNHDKPWHWEPGAVEILPNLHFVPDGTLWEWEGIRFGAFGGAVSIDKKMRTIDVSWWPDEITDPAMVKVAQRMGYVDILFTHDGPTQVRQILKIRKLNDHVIEDESYANGLVINDIVKACRPKMHIFGHWHDAARWDCYGVDTILLNNADGLTVNSSIILDLEQLTKQWNVVD